MSEAQGTEEVPEPGTRIKEGVFESVACVVLNSPNERVKIPAIIIDMIQKASGVVEILWPLGVYVGFTSEGMTVGIFGRKENGEVAHGVSQKEMNEYEMPDVGEAVWEMWKRLRRQSLYYIMMGNYGQLLRETKERHKLTD